MADGFQDIFNRLTGHAPYRWQQRLYQAHLSRGRDGLPSALDIPTGLGKTSVMAAWLAAWHLGAGDLPRRLVYVVDRRVVVDQATAEADKLAKGWNELTGKPLAVSTLRGQHADNRAWLADPAAPAIVVGTVDMIGSRLLFEGYNVSRGMRPNQAGLLGVDSLVVLDESHLCPPFEALLREIETAVGLRGAASEAAALIRPLRLLSLSATGDAQSAAAETFRLEPQDESDPPVAERLNADKRLTVADMPDGGKPELALSDTARALVEDAPARVLVFCHRRTLALKVREALGKGWPRGERPEVALLVGARRGWERERLAARLEAGGWLGGGARMPPDRPAFLVATSAGEVGVDLDADHMVCDLVPAERMIQRLGRVNRRGGDERIATIQVLVLPADKKRKPSDDEADRLRAVRAFLAALPAGANGDDEDHRIASPATLVAAKQAHPDLLARASTPKPLRPELTRALVDNWSLTSLREHPGRPRPGPWLRGWEDDERPQSTLLWRRWLPWHQGPDGKTEGPADRAVVTEYFAAARPHPAELLEIWTDEALTILIARAKAVALPDGTPAVLVLNRTRDYEDHLTVGDLRDLNRNRWMPRLAGRLLVVSALLGGIDADGMLSDKAAGAPLPKPRAADQENAPENTAEAAGDGWPGCLDDGWPEEELEKAGIPIRVVPPGREAPQGDWKIVWKMPWTSGDADTPDWLQVAVLRKGASAGAGDPAVRRKEQALTVHHACVEAKAERIATDLGLPDEYRLALSLAARWHDAGKARTNWQRAMGAPMTGGPYAKTTGGGNLALLRINNEIYRHEFGSLKEADASAEIAALPEPLRDLALHLIAAHHGNGRPTLTAQDWNQPDAQARQRRAQEVALRFSRLHHAWGPWGLAWWEALLRAADRAASAELDAAEADREGGA